MLYALTKWYNNGLAGADNIEGDKLMGVFSDYDKAKQAAIDFKPRAFNVADEQQRVVTELDPQSHFNDGVVRTLREYVDDFHKYYYELYITELEIDKIVD